MTRGVGFQPARISILAPNRSKDPPRTRRRLLQLRARFVPIVTLDITECRRFIFNISVGQTNSPVEEQYCN
jgi:hypothetical protein